MKRRSFIAGVMLGTIGCAMVLENPRVQKVMEKLKNN